VLQGHTAAVYGIAFAPDGRRLATASYDTTGRIWSVETGQSEAVLRGHVKEVHCVAWRPDGQVVATGSYDRSIRLWGPDGRSFQGFDGLDNEIMSLTFTADSRGLLFTWGGVSTSSRGAALLDLSTGKERVRFGHTNTVPCGALSPDGTLAATAGGNDYEIYLWKTADAAPVHRLASRGRAAWSAAWSPDGKTIAWGSTNKGSPLKATMPLERTFRTVDLEFADAPDANFRRAQLARGSVALESTGKTTVAVKRGDETVATLKMADAYEWVRCSTLLPGDRTAVGTEFGLYLFDTRSGQQLRAFQGHTGIVWAVAPSPDGRYLLSASNDMTLRVWDPDRDEPLLSLFFAGDDWVAWTPEGYYAASPDGEKLMGWHVNKGRDQMADFYPATRFRKTLYRPDVIKLLLSTGSTERALAVADQARGKATERTEVAEVLPPEVTITAPDRSGLRLASSRLEVQALARSRGTHPVTALRLLLDGRPYLGLRGVKTIADPRLGEVRAAWTVELDPGKHKLAVQADSAASQAVSEPVEVVYVGGAPEEAIELPRLYVLAVGVSAYPGDLHLNYAARDAEAIERHFRENSGPLFRKVEPRLLTDAKATRREILGGLTWLRQQMTQRDVAVVFFSGHGQRDAEGSLFLLPVDVDTDDLLATAVADDQLKKALAGLPGRVIALLDACHAGAVGGDKRKGTGGLTDDLVRDLVTDDYGVIVMASSMGRESSLESNADRQGYFTLALTEGLAGQADLNKDGVVYLNELDAYVTERVKALTRGQQHPVTAKPTSIRSFPLAKP
jgi:WD40 repeat protein